MGHRFTNKTYGSRGFPKNTEADSPISSQDCTKIVLNI